MELITAWVMHQDRQVVLAEIVPNTIKLRTDVESGGKCTFSFAVNGDWVPLPHKFQARKGAWTGARLGLYSVKQLQNAPSGHVDIDYFRFL